MAKAKLRLRALTTVQQEAIERLPFADRVCPAGRASDKDLPDAPLIRVA